MLAGLDLAAEQAEIGGQCVGELTVCVSSG
jgi:hypothetical protein